METDGGKVSSFCRVSNFSPLPSPSFRRSFIWETKNHRAVFGTHAVSGASLIILDSRSPSCPFRLM